MLNLVWPWFLLLAPLPWFYRWWRAPVARRGSALVAPVYSAVSDGGRTSYNSRSRYWLIWLLLSVIWLSLVLSSSRPQWIGEPNSLPTSGRDMLLAVDISGSMEQADMQVGNKLVDRLTVVKTVVGEFVARRRGDRMGLVVFGSNAYLQTPLTFDLETLNSLLQDVLIGFAGKDTAIGDAIGLAVKRLKDRPENARVIILLTDGANTSGQVAPLKAAQLAAAYGVKIYTIGIGADQILRRSLFGTQLIKPSIDLDEETLQKIADLTGGQYFRAHNPEELSEIYATLDGLEPVAQEEEIFRPTKSLFYLPMILALLASFTLALLKGTGEEDG